MEKWTVGVDGVGCPFCAYGLEKKLGAVPGVTSFHFRFVDAEIDIEAARGATVTPDALADAVDKAGFGLRSLVIVGSGAVVTGSDGKVLKIGGLSLPLLDYDGPEGTATVRGELERSNGQWHIRIIPPGK
jgi:copper chaperone CopZ